MSHFLARPPWHIPDRALTDPASWRSRRSILRTFGLGAIGAALPAAHATELVVPDYPYRLPKVRRNPAYPLDRELTAEDVAATYNNFYELTTDKAGVWKLAHTLQPKPWSVIVHGLCHKPKTFSMEALLKKMPIEERTYRFRCVEAWSMAVPWAGFPLRALIEAVKPMTSAKFVRLVTADEPRMFPGVRAQPWYPWPYFEGLSMAEATHELTLMAVGIYGHALPNQHGAPIRLWNTVAAAEYDFLGNVRPDIPHPRWSQATERVIPTGERVPTLMYNGYADLVASMYG